jgi:MarR family transcriptional regulator, organic hydroperoxide resistance regulator
MRNQTIDFLFRSTWLAINKMYNEEAAKFDSTISIGFTLLSIDTENGTPSTALGPKMGIESTSLTRTLKNMDEQGLIIKKKNPEDGRSILIFLTQKGKEKRELSKQKVFQFNNKIKEKITTTEIDMLNTVSKKIIALITNKEIF